jgi:hypothetical protein
MKIKQIKSMVSASVVGVLSPLAIIMPASAATDVCTWTGGGADTNVSTAANWTGCDNGNIPENGDSLVFPAVTSSSVSVINDSLTSIGDITVLGASNPNSYGISFTTVGGAIDLSGDITIGQDQSLSISSSVNLLSDTNVELETSDSYFNIGGPLLDLGANKLTFNYSGFSGLTSTSNKSELPSVYFLGFTSGLAPGSSGTEIIANGINMYWNATGTTYTGQLTLNKSILSFNQDANIGSTSKGVLLNQSQLKYNGTSKTIDEPLTINGNLFNQKGSGLEIGYEAIGNPSGGKPTFTNVTLQSDIAVDPFSNNIEFSGSLSGKYLIGGSQVYTVDANKGHIIISATNNTSKLPNGDYVIESNTAPVTDNQPTQDVIVESDSTVTINGQRGKVIVSTGGTLKGTGTVSDVSLLTLARLAPGESPGCINTGNLTFSSGSFYDVEIEGVTECTEYDRTNVTGSVDVTGANLNLTLPGTYVPSVNTSFMIIDNDGSDAVVGTFNGLEDGATFEVNGVNFQINYNGGDGNDVMVLAIATPTAPDTGVGSLLSSPIASLLAALAVLGIIGGLKYADTRKK